MPDSSALSESKEARSILLQKWADIMTDLTTQFHEQCRANGLKPEWYYPKTIIEKDNNITIHWGLRPDVEIAFKMIADGKSVEEAAKAAASIGAKSLDQLIMDDTVWQ